MPGGYAGWMSSANDGQQGVRDARLAMLAWYRQMGVDAAVADIGVDWLARGDVAPARVSLNQAGQSPAASKTTSSRADRSGGRHRGRPDRSAVRDDLAPERQPPPQARPTAAREFVTVAPEAAEADARDAAGAATTIDALGDALAQFDGCGLKATAKNLCFFRGAAQARVMVIGEAPGRDEDRSGVPFVGRAGQLLDKMLAAIGLKDTEVHITNVVYWRPPGNRTPTPQEVLVCRPFLERQIVLAEPEIILTVGGPAAKAIVDTPQGIMKTRGKWATFTTTEGRDVRVMPTLHPAYLLRTPAAKRLAWRDLLAVRAALDESG